MIVRNYDISLNYDSFWRLEHFWFSIREIGCEGSVTFDTFALYETIWRIKFTYLL